MARTVLPVYVEYNLPDTLIAFDNVVATNVEDISRFGKLIIETMLSTENTQILDRRITIFFAFSETNNVSNPRETLKGNIRRITLSCPNTNKPSLNLFGPVDVIGRYLYTWIEAEPKSNAAFKLNLNLIGY